ncbi:MAG: mechanosensitive ion channel [Clostridia bacterium]|nr:mechanosensitive ion channel [Clostridia bacterium]
MKEWLESLDFLYLFEKYALPLLTMVLVVVVGWIVAGIAKRIIVAMLEKVHADISLEKFLAAAASIAIKVVAVISAIGILGVPTTGLVAGVSAVAAAIALALKDSLSNVSGGIFLLITRPFLTGNIISVNGETGAIKEIKLVHTVILTGDNREIIIPNSVMMNSTVVNLSNEDKRRVDLVFSIGYNNDARLAREIILNVLIKHELTLTDEIEPFARVTAHSASSVDITARVWTLAKDYWTVYFDVLEQVREEFNEKGISIPYNQLDVHIDGNVKNV